MWTASFTLSHRPLLRPPFVSHRFSYSQPSPSSGCAKGQCLGWRLWPRTVVRALKQSLRDGSNYSTDSGRRMILFMSSISFFLPPCTWAETFTTEKFIINNLYPLPIPRSDAFNLLTIQNSLRAVLSKAKAAGMLRMAFHDAGTFDMEDHSGGMNGSILYELDRPENTGLSKSLKILEKAMEFNKVNHVSWADLIAVAGAEAVFLCGGPLIPVKLGRLDVSTQELVVLSGAHTLGSKGFGNPNVFDNTYYKILLEKAWKSSGSMSRMIGLPSDHALVEDDECLSWVKVYAGDQDNFFDDFAKAYTKLVDLGAIWRSDII